MSDQETKLRADARANRDRILDVASEALAADPGASLNMIAKAAGVGAGTLYRHFPSREALLVGVYRKEIDTQVALAATLLAKQPPLDALRLWCLRFIRFGRIKHGVGATFQAAIADQDLHDAFGPLATAVGQLLGACERAGAIRAGTRPEDLLTLLALLLRIPSNASAGNQAQRILELVFRGLRVTE